jgi:signal transduction histidine kinase
MTVDDLGTMEVLSEFLNDCVKSLAGVPLRVGDRLLGVLHVGASDPRRFTEDDLDMLRLVGDRAALAIARARADESERQARTAIEAAERRASFLAEASRILAPSLDVDDTLERLARLAVPAISDLCVINTVDDEGMIRRPAAVFVDPAREALVRDLQRRFPIDPAGSHPVARVLRTGHPDIVADISDAVLARIATDPEHRRIARELGYASYIVVPLVARGRTLGAISLVSGPSGRRYGNDDLALAEDLARRAALAVDNARLYRQAEAARAAAESANRMKDEFLAMLSHELRTPLTSIVGWARMLLGTAPDEATRLRGLAVIERSANLQARLIEDLLDIARFMRGDARLDLRPIDAGHVVEAAVEAARPAAEAKGLVLERQLAPGAVDLSGDADRLQQVVGNLLANAVKFTPAGGRVTVRLTRAERQVRITVSDTGRGISATLLPHVFEAFRQGERSEPGGLGLGLAIVRQVVELHGGSVQVESPGEGRGAAFTVVLPRATSPGP